jgi:hypothetical protein
MGQWRALKSLYDETQIRPSQPLTFIFKLAYSFGGRTLKPSCFVHLILVVGLVIRLLNNTITIIDDRLQDLKQ